MSAHSMDKETPEERISAVPPEIEESIIVAFGHSLLEFEDTLYVKFQVLTRGLVVTKPEFLGHIKDMEERGVLVPAVFLGRRCWMLKPRTSGH